MIRGMPCDHPNLRTLKPLQIAAVRPAHHITAQLLDWSIAMRSVLALSLLIALCAPANAARVHHAKPRHVIVRPVQSPDPRDPPVLQDQTPSYDDPSKFGGG
jgi:hypothetical protein